jgi:hypothetical protein
MPRSAKAAKAATGAKAAKAAKAAKDDLLSLGEGEALMASPRAPYCRGRSRSPCGCATPGDDMSSGATTEHDTPRGEMDPQATPQTGGMHSGDTGPIRGGRHRSRVNFGADPAQSQAESQAESLVTLSQAIQASLPFGMGQGFFQPHWQIPLPTGGLPIFVANVNVHIHVHGAPAQNKEATTQRQLDFQ